MRDLISIVEKHILMETSGYPAERFLHDLKAAGREWENMDGLKFVVVGDAKVAAQFQGPAEIGLKELSVQSYNRGKGAGGALLKLVCDLADKHGVTLYGNAYPLRRMLGDPIMKQDDLTAWYVRHGFKVADEPAARGVNVVRKPKSSLNEEFDHPHLRGEDEEFSMLYGAYTLNVDLARRLIASGEVQATPYDMPVKKGGQMLLGLSEEEFGSKGEIDTGGNLMGNAVDRRRFAVIPQEKYDEPALMVMWNAHRADPKGNADMPDRAYPQLIDGSHRLEKRYLDGDEGVMKTLVVQDFEDIKKFTSDRKGPMTRKKR